MRGVQIRTLLAEDGPPLLAFELAHRQWFEQHIEPRGDAFYSPDGVREHIATFLAGHAAGTFHPCVLTDNKGAIIGRANLKNIDRQAGTAEIGYRIGQTHVGRGLATAAVRFLSALAQTEYRLAELSAFILEKNAASARVVQKCGFTRRGSPAKGLWQFTLVLQDRATKDPAPVPPVQPALEDCCRSGCTPCVFDLYDEALERYRSALAAWEARQADRAR